MERWKARVEKVQRMTVLFFIYGVSDWARFVGWRGGRFDVRGAREGNRRE